MNGTMTDDQPQALARTAYDTSTGLAVDVAQRDLTMDDHVYAGMSERPVDERQAEILTRGVGDDDIDVRPDGAIYMSHARLRMRLNEAFRPGGWALRQLTPVTAMSAQGSRLAEGNVVTVLTAGYALYAEGRFLSAARGEQKYQDNGEMTYSDAVEGLKSNALTRCCKDLGIALQLWDRTFADNWRARHCVKVWRDNPKFRRPQWRLLTAMPFNDESGIAADSPNQDRYVQPVGAQRPARRQEQAPPFTAPAPQPVQRDREPGEDDEPRQAQATPPTNGGQRGGRIISEAQGKRLFAIARGVNVTGDAYKAFLSKWGYTTDRDVLVADYDKMIADLRPE
jgi:hypothetical protein